MDSRGDIVYSIINNYGRSLLYGCSNLHQSLPRMLTLWFNYGSRQETFFMLSNEAKKCSQLFYCRVAELTNSRKAMPAAAKKLLEDMQGWLSRMCDFMNRFQDKISKFMFLAAYSQLTSRICHSHPDVWQVLRTILLNCFLEYPHHCFWQIVSLVKSSYSTR